MSFGKMNQLIELVETANVKDLDGFISSQSVILAKVHAFMETKNATEKWSNMATFSTATALFRFRVIPNLEVTTSMTIHHGNAFYQILSVENVRSRNRYLEVLAEKIEGS